MTAFWQRILLGSQVLEGSKYGSVDSKMHGIIRMTDDGWRRRKREIDGFPSSDFWTLIYA